MSIEGQGHFFTIYFPDFVCFVLYLAKISGERLQDHWSSGFFFIMQLTSKQRTQQELIYFLNLKKKEIKHFYEGTNFAKGCS